MAVEEQELISACQSNYPWADAKAKKLHDKRIHRITMQSLLDEQHEERRRSQTIREVAAAKDRVEQAWRLSRASLEQAIDRMKERNSS